MSLGVLIPTFRRNDGLERALLSVFAQGRRPDRIVVCDNAPEAGAQTLVESLQASAPCPLIYVHAAQPGVANARNAGFEACADLDRIAQLDDDETACEGWIEALERMADQTHAAVVFGPVAAMAQGAGAVRTAWLRSLYARLPDLEDGPIDKPWGCGNSLIDRTVCALPEPVFDPSTNDTGGEDDRLFSQLAAQGAVFAWSSRAQVSEHVDPARGRWRALARRAFAYGQGPSQEAASRKAFAELALWMGVGAGQALVFGFLALPARLAGAQACARCIDKAVQGAGKLVWFDRFAPKFYGSALVDQAR